MAIYNWLLIALVIISLTAAIYIEWLAALRFSPTLFVVALRRPARKDLAIFVLLLIIVFIQQLLQPESRLTSGLLLGLILLTLWFGWIRQPVAIVNPRGFLINGRFVPWQQVKDYRLSEDGTLELQLTNDRLQLRVKNVDDLEKIFQHCLSSPD